MSLLAVVVRVAEETEFDPDTVSPGVAGFFAFAALGIGIILLGFNMVRRLRRNSYRADVREQIEQKLADQNGTVGAVPAESGEAGSDAAESVPGQRGPDPAADPRA